MKNTTKLITLALMAFLIGLGSVAISADQVQAGPKEPAPNFCDCTRYFECGAASSMCGGRPALMAYKALSDCILMCDWYEVGCCSLAE